MNVIVSNQQQNVLSNIDIDVIKSISGTYSASEIVEMFKNFFFNKMILDVTALKGYDNAATYKTIAGGLDPSKIIVFIPEKSQLCTSRFFSTIVSFGIYNFTTNIDGVKYLIKHTNTIDDVAQFKKATPLPIENNEMKSNFEEVSTSDKIVQSNSFQQAVNQMPTSRIIGIKNVTKSAGSTTFTYMLQKELSTHINDKVVAVEVDKNEFKLFGNSKDLISTPKQSFGQLLNSLVNTNKIVFVDLNDTEGDESRCHDVIYLIEPSIIKLNKLMKLNGGAVLKSLQGKKVVLNKSLLSKQDVMDFERESGLRIFYNMPPLNERKQNDIICDFLSRLGLMNFNNTKSNTSSKVFGLFRK